ncbi:MULTISPECIES: hypothetical protein [unclassified Pseudomonas]|jgi:hypothetical protein|uniref:Uncharacterized protein n=1 Tax=Pseudomonas gorinensis TaxID=3240790 RepID=A0ACA7P5E7_9PSED|nr:MULTISPECIES: hypothetical protein [unclassified Pseudomonas]AHC35231.1 hypothetical protein U771_13540 [Pseudomonas sp. TKP]MBL1309015.1 hypothetical protein [Pseudomonas sp.]PMY08348.1 hypothetical protein C1Y18_10085 [Pseudomonas sp. MPR-R5A]WLI53881.1 hypothetical protein PSH63_14455 [Pseudomonas sp. FP833]SDZ66153.1 hypothetical protein SAMN05444743_12744 [Pseudomonas sp. PDC86]
MSYHVTHRYGAMSSNPGIHTFPELLAELKARPEDEEHGDVSVTDEADWCISVNLSRTVTFENLESGEPRHMKGVPETKILELWRLLADGDVAAIEQEPWLPGYL